MLALLATLCLALAAPDDELVLVDGAVIRGIVLKETEAALFVDVGFSVVEVPRASVAVRNAREAEGAAPADAPVPDSGLWAQRELPRLSVQDAVQRFGEGVVVVRTPSGTGSGFIIREDGYLVTNAHVVQGEIEVSVIVYRSTDDGFEKQIFERCRLVAVNPFIDLALVQIDADELGDTQLTRVFLGDVEATQVGEPVFAIGAPLGMDRSVSEGIVSIKNRSHEGKVYVQTTAAINPGNSGGPLFNERGEVIAVNTLGYMFAEGLNLSIPVDYVKHFIANRDAFAYDRDSPNSGYHYLAPPGRPDDEPTEP